MPDPIEERDIEKLILMLDDERIQKKIASFLKPEVWIDAGGPHHDRDGSWDENGRISTKQKETT